MAEHVFDSETNLCACGTSREQMEKGQKIVCPIDHTTAEARPRATPQSFMVNAGEIGDRMRELQEEYR